MGCSTIPVDNWACLRAPNTQIDLIDILDIEQNEIQ